MSCCFASAVIGVRYNTSSQPAEMLLQVLGGAEILQLPKKTEDLSRLAQPCLVNCLSKLSSETLGNKSAPNVYMQSVPVCEASCTGIPCGERHFCTWLIPCGP